MSHILLLSYLDLLFAHLASKIMMMMIDWEIFKAEIVISWSTVLFVIYLAPSYLDRQLFDTCLHLLFAHLASEMMIMMMIGAY